jgi:hypothetical protein
MLAMALATRLTTGDFYTLVHEQSLHPALISDPGANFA